MEFELNGAITDNWQLTFGATRYIAEDNEGNAVNPNLPRTTVKMFTSYRLPVMPELTVGGGVNWQNRVYTDTVTPYGTFRAEQGSYALVDLFTRYQVTKTSRYRGTSITCSTKPTIPTWKVLSSTAHRVISALPARINSE